MARRLAFVLQIESEVFAAHAVDNGWEQLAADDSSDEDRPAQRWRVPGGELRFVDDTVVEVQYVDLEADPAGPVEEAIKADLTCYDREDCLDVVDLGAREETVCHALRLLTVTAPGPFDQRVVDVTVSALRDDREDVRVAAMMIADYTKWSQFLPHLGQSAAGDPSARVRRFAGSHKFVLELAAKVAGGA